MPQKLPGAQQCHCGTVCQTTFEPLTALVSVLRGVGVKSVMLFASRPQSAPRVVTRAAAVSTEPVHCTALLWMLECVLHVQPDCLLFFPFVCDSLSALVQFRHITALSVVYTMLQQVIRTQDASFRVGFRVARVRALLAGVCVILRASAQSTDNYSV